MSEHCKSFVQFRGVSMVSLAAALTFAAPAWAQSVGTQEDPRSVEATGSASPTTPSSNEGIVVTGSRIARRDLDTPAPLAVVTGNEFKLSGAVNVESVLNQLPQVVPSTTAFSNNPGGGVALLNLRGLGSQRTLVLVNGRRYMFYDVTQRTDLNTIPQFLIQGVDVVTGGASAVYGSDAIAGVANFRLRNDVKGLEIGSQYSITGDGDGPRYDAHVAIGGEFAENRGHMTAYAQYYRRKPVLGDARDFAEYTLSDNAAHTGFVNSGNSSIPAGRFVAAGSTAFGAGTNFANTTLGAIITQPGATSRPYTASDAYNTAPYNYLMVPQKRWLAGAYGDYEVNSHIKAYTELSFVNNRVPSSVAPVPVSGTYLFNIAAARQYLSAADYSTLSLIGSRQAAANYSFTSRDGTIYSVGPNQVALNVYRRISEAGNRSLSYDFTSYRALGGLTGEIVPNWSYDAYYMYARTKNTLTTPGSVSHTVLQNGLLSGAIDFFGEGSITSTALSSLEIPVKYEEESTLQVANASVQGKLFNFGMGADDVSLVFGGEYRSMSAQFISDASIISGNAIGVNLGNSTAGGYHVKELFSELSVPIIARQPFIHRLEVDARARYSKYSLGMGVWTWAFGAEYAPVRDITFRGQYSRAVRAPNVSELYGGNSVTYVTATDPCAQSAARTNATLNALCVATGVPANLVGLASVQPSTQLTGVTGGNPNLNVERSTSYTFGAVIRPRWIPRLNITADYYNINLRGAIAQAAGGLGNTLNLCYNVLQDANSVFCQFINRNPSTGSIDNTRTPTGGYYSIDQTQANLGFYKTSGVDIAADYTQPLNFGIGVSQSRLNIGASATWTQRFDIQAATGLAVLHCAGHFGLSCGEPIPRWKINTRLTFINGPVSLSLKWLRLGAVQDDSSTVYTTDRIKSYNRFDLAAAVDVGEGISFAAGVNNIADKKPPILGSNQSQSNTYPNTYDVLGRDLFVSAQFRF